MRFAASWRGPGARMKKEQREKRRAVPSAAGPCALATTRAHCYGAGMATMDIGFLLFPDLFQLDLTGAYGVLAAGPDAAMHLIGKDLRPVRSSDGLLITPTVTMRECPQLKVICVPGGEGILPVLEGEETLAVARAARKLRGGA